MIFDNTKQAYILKSDHELYQAFYLFKIISNKTLVYIGSKLALIAIKLRFPISGIFRRTIFKQFCAGFKKEDSIKVINRLNKLDVKSYLHYASEGQNSELGMDFNFKKTIETISFSKTTNALPFTVFKATSLGSITLFKKKSSGIVLNLKETAAWDRIIDRILKCCKYAKELNVKMLIDAEESWVQNAIDEIAEESMELFNKKEAFIFTTLQLYRKDRLQYLKELFNKANKKDFRIGIKLVRGAYLEKENKRSMDLDIPSIICESKEATDTNINTALDYILPRTEQCKLFLGSHCEASILKVTEWMKSNEIPNDYSNIWFSQLYGMADHISFNLAAQGYNVIKYVPYGPVKEVVPYLIRRAEENTSVRSQTPRELNLIKKELKRRKFKGFEL
jgi:proline dehydrogenase